ncbi:MAG: hypothetical protein FWE22_00490 [Firmicutes bacterium]|nr:hypothetical protein [Bacillota bacterium]
MTEKMIMLKNMTVKNVIIKTLDSFLLFIEFSFIVPPVITKVILLLFQKNISKLRSFFGELAIPRAIFVEE